MTYCGPGAPSNRDLFGKEKTSGVTKITRSLHIVQAMGWMPRVAISGELDLKNGWAQLANARYASESVGPGGGQSPPRQGAETLTVLTSLAEVRAAVNEIAATAQRLISIYTPDLEPDLYDQTPFLEVIKHFVLTRSFSKVRVLLAEPSRVMRDSNRFVAMGRRLSSCIDIRYVAAHSPQRASAYLIADDRAIVYRLRADSWDGVADINNQQAARAYLQEFDQVWNASAAEHGLRASRRG
ncbi:MAG: hypothetical protein ACLPTM_16950 [Steroidobacteraceae bacterium]